MTTSPAALPSHKAATIHPGPVDIQLTTNIAEAVAPTEHADLQGGRQNTDSTKVSPPGTTSQTTAQKEKPIKSIGVLGRVNQLSEAEQGEFMALEIVIGGEFTTYLDIGRALKLIRDKILYREQYGTFESYHRIRWQFAKTKVYCLIGAAEVYELLAGIPDVPKPECEAHLRPLTGLPPDQVRQAWQLAAKKAPNGVITARAVKAALAELEPAPDNRSAQLEARHERSKRRQELRDTMTDLLQLIMSKAPHDILIQKAGLVDGHIRYFFPKPRKR